MTSYAPYEPEIDGSNPTDNPHLSDLLAVRSSRRRVLQGGLAAAAVGFFGQPLLATSAAATPELQPGQSGRLLGFRAVPVSTADALVVPEGYTARVLIPWGTPLLSSGPAWRRDAFNTAAEQAEQVGMHHDGMHFFPLDSGQDGSERGLLVLNHEYVNQILLFPDGDAVMTAEKVQKALNAHGVTVIEVRRVDGAWTQVDSRYNRRITGSTPVAFSGPVSADHPLLASPFAPAGTLNNCAHGVTPWGTYLACEENFNGYFGTTDSAWQADPLQARYGFSRTGFGYKWHTVEPRFDIARHPGEGNRFGWVVEIDPTVPGSVPVKRTALGRVKHESATVTTSRNRVVVYTGDDENKDYVYKFVGAGSYRSVLARGRSPLDDGTLYVGRFHDDGTGEWLPLVHGQGVLTTGNGWIDQADVLIRTRQAADAVGATRLDRPEWIAVDERTKDVYLTLTNGSTGAGAVNPRSPNPYGSIVKWREAGGHNDSLTFDWEIWLLAGDPAKDPRATLTPEDGFGSPDGIWTDPDGRVWIQTDVSNSVQRRGDYEALGNNQMLVADPETKDIRRFLVGPNGCEVTGVVTTPDQRTMFVNIQHPGEATTAIGAPTVDNPRAVSNWPDYDPAGRPRPATVVITKDDGGVIGT